MFLIELFRGMGITLKHFFGKTITIQYPEQRRPLYDRTRWRHILRRHGSNLERCIGCSLCAGSCPVHCIRVVAAENTDADRRSPGEAVREDLRDQHPPLYLLRLLPGRLSTSAIVLLGLRARPRPPVPVPLHQKEMLLGRSPRSNPSPNPSRWRWPQKHARMTVPDPRRKTGPFEALFKAIRACKSANTCPALRTRQFFYEPNGCTAPLWKDEGVDTSDSIDHRVMFVCESPGPSASEGTPAVPKRCWSITKRDLRFQEARKRYGFESCYITKPSNAGSEAADGIRNRK